MHTDATVTCIWVLHFHQCFISATAFGHVLEFTTFSHYPQIHSTLLSLVKFLTYHVHAQMMLTYTHLNASFTAVAHDEETKMYLTFQ
jgi:hypothetical protein